MEQIHQDETIPVDATPTLIDREGYAVIGIGRLDQVIGGTAAREFFEDRAARRKFLHTRAVGRWTGAGTGYRKHHTSKR